MLNLKFFVIIILVVIIYCEFIMKVLLIGSSFDLLMIFYLIDKIYFDEIKFVSKYLFYCFFIIFRYILVVFLW